MKPKTDARLLIIDDDMDILGAARLLLKQHFSIVRTESNPDLIPQLLKDDTYDVVLLDMNFTRDITSGKEGFLWLSRIRQIDPLAVVILITAYGDVETAVQAIKEGASDFVLKPWQNEKLLATIIAALNLSRSRREANALRSKQQTLSSDMDMPFHDFIGASPSMQQVFHTIEKVAATDANVLVLGENGTGKELVARAVHRKSLRNKEVFISVDMGAITETLFESQLFGYVKGAFTDARENRAGRFEVASGGTLFLDEIGNIPLPLQAKLLNVIQSRKIVRVGGTQPIPIDIRLISATNMPLHQMVKDGTFRQDLLYRINTVEIHLPPLRDRREDIPALVDHFIQMYAGKYRKDIGALTVNAVKKLMAYHWPGNVRELQHAIERAIIMGDDPELNAGDFLLVQESETADELAFSSWNLDDVERTVVRKVLKRVGGNVSQAARELGLTRAALYRRMEKYGL
jgi:DNA-binding NtrC family response regulator